MQRSQEWYNTISDDLVWYGAYNEVCDRFDRKRAMRLLPESGLTNKSYQSLRSDTLKAIDEYNALATRNQTLLFVAMLFTGVIGVFAPFIILVG